MGILRSNEHITHNHIRASISISNFIIGFSFDSHPEIGNMIRIFLGKYVYIKEF